jgi:DNA invertase Pin-like site-specific DNA recombinase
MAGILAQVAEFDNELRSERIQAGQAAARAAGKKRGGHQKRRRWKVSDLQARIIHQMKQDGDTVAAIARAVGISRPTVYSVLADGNAAPLRADLLTRAVCAEHSTSRKPANLRQAGVR